MMIACKWDHKRKEYNPYELPEGASCYEDDMEKVVHCAHCGRKVLFGDCYTSREVHTKHGFGYGVCRECYEQEWEREREHVEEQQREYDMLHEPTYNEEDGSM